MDMSEFFILGAALKHCLTTKWWSTPGENIKINLKQLEKDRLH